MVGRPNSRLLLTHASRARRRAPSAALARESARRQDQDDDEEQEERDQERLARRVVLGPVLEHAPGRRDDEGGDEADQVEQPPGLRPRDQRDAGVEHEVVA